MVIKDLTCAVRTKSLSVAGLPMAENCGGSITFTVVVTLASPSTLTGRLTAAALFLLAI